MDRTNTHPHSSRWFARDHLSINTTQVVCHVCNKAVESREPSLYINESKALLPISRISLSLLDRYGLVFFHVALDYLGKVRDVIIHYITP